MVYYLLPCYLFTFIFTLLTNKQLCVLCVVCVCVCVCACVKIIDQVCANIFHFITRDPF